MSKPKPMSVNNTKFYIDGEWVEPATPQIYEVINPATEEPAGQISMGSSADVDRAVAASRLLVRPRLVLRVPRSQTLFGNEERKANPTWLSFPCLSVSFRG